MYVTYDVAFTRQETHTIMVSNIYRGIALGIAKAASIATAAAMLVTYAAVGHELTVSTVFRTLLYSDLMTYFGVTLIPRCVQDCGQLLNSLHRIQVTAVCFFLCRLQRNMTFTDTD